MSYRILLLLLGLSHWPLWIWYIRRLTDGSDEPLGILALGASLLFVPWRKLKGKVPSWLLISVLGVELCFLLFAHHWVPLVRGLVVGLMLAFLFIHLKAPYGILGLLCLSLPWIATLQFYAGYPLRVLTGEVTRWLLLLPGYEISREGIVLLWNHHRVIIDRPCAGISMLWFGGFLSYLLASWYRLNLRACLILGLSSFSIILCANILRNFLLFFTETGVIQAPGFIHEAIGVVLFVGAIGFLAKISETGVPGRALRSAD